MDEPKKVFMSPEEREKAMAQARLEQQQAEKAEANDNATSSVFFLPKKTFHFVIWNTEEKRDDHFYIEQTMLPGQTDEILLKLATMKTRGMIEGKKCFDGQKVRFIEG